MTDGDANDTFLNDIWAMYFHDPNDSDWTTSSYVRMGDISTIEEFWSHFLCLKHQVHKGMFFLMREHVFPCWDDPANIQGGCLSIKILKDDMAELWEDMCMKLVGETLLKPEHRHKWTKINGISTSPKKHFCIIKIWVADGELSDKNMYDIKKVYHGDLMYKSNQDNITNDRA